ncbi:polysaccharide deacetylase family protein [Streptomyces sp. NPDC006530]|uniref:polysaccharide deacetylase family protein n=1 Tax=Streptomyces sp. NPDC006530 TaxID=3364750 RepID=UPI00369E2856
MRRAHRFRAALAGLLAAGALLGPLAGCTEQAAPVGPFQRLGRKAAQRGVPRVGPDARAVAARHWGLGGPLTVAPRPAAGQGPELPYVVDHVPMRAKVVFLTFDGGPGVDPGFVRMVRDLALPVTLFPTDAAAGAEGEAGAGPDTAAPPGRDRVEALRALGAGVHEYAPHLRDLRTLDHAGQRAEICGRRSRLATRAGEVRPRLLRPPYGAYDATTLRAARECGITAVVLARATMTPDGLRYAGGARGLRPGDIVRAPLPAPGDGAARLAVRLLEQVRAQGFAVGHLEDHL